MKVVLIFGGSGSLGRHIAEDLKENYTVVISDQNSHDVSLAAEEVGVEGIECDITDYQSVERAVNSIVETHGGIDVVINSAGLYASGSIEDVDPEEARRVFEVNALGPLFVAKAVIPHMKTKGEGLVLNINSVGGLHAKADRSVYYSSKWALTGITKNLQVELAGTKIRVTDIYPAAFEKTMLRDGQPQEQSHENTMSYDEMVAAVRYVIERPSDILVTGIELHNPSYQNNI